MPTMLNPLQQRLFLYRFAVVHIAPGLSVSPQSWSLPGLQWLSPVQNANRWTSMFANCLPFSPVTGYPVISPSLAALKRLRRCQPRRPLIFVQTAFERLRRHRTLTGAVGPSIPLSKALVQDDPLRPLYWLDRWPDRETPWLEIYRGMGRHPRLERMQDIEKWNPFIQILIQENGDLLLQPNLFVPFRGEKDRVSSRAHIRAFDRKLAKRLEPLKGRFYVFSAKAETLDWFRRDCLRIFGIRAFCWGYPMQPDPRDPLTHFLLVRDSEIRFRRFSSGIPQFHLDGKVRNARYRAARCGEMGSARWVAPDTPQVVARHRVEHRCLSFVHGPDGWRSHACDMGNASNQDALFRKRLLLFR